MLSSTLLRGVNNEEWELKWNSLRNFTMFWVFCIEIHMITKFTDFLKIQYFLYFWWSFGIKLLNMAFSSEKMITCVISMHIFHFFQWNWVFSHFLRETTKKEKILSLQVKCGLVVMETIGGSIFSHLDTLIHLMEDYSTCIPMLCNADFSLRNYLKNVIVPALTSVLNCQSW